ncbi:polysaccharide deacetylase [Mobilisporobacter senegalensis]|uniref:Polysaccharide deacetylase n=1 Tax=Mobilisporobacter senegalensis TaxID=1329262 RepID=A0A3N1XZ43_9FIRM|nr:polysaccharide deacetylase family protein [Mobilisporobacter senegalensis]ROR31865.1 polysaccharide deacetylase [Mobilisporobacter senegalensis]
MDKKAKVNLLSRGILIGILITLVLNLIKDSVVEVYPVLSENQKICVPIIMYHQVKNYGYGKDVISPYEFESDLVYLKENNYTTITMNDLIDYVYNDKQLPKNPIVLSFDDGHLSIYKYVYPLLKEYDMKIVLSVIGKGIDDFTKVHDENMAYSHVTWDQIKEMKESGHIEVQNHSYNLHTCNNGRIGCLQKRNESLEDYQLLLSDDLEKCQNQIVINTGSVPNTFAYPYGETSENCDSVVRQLGFKATLSCRYGVNIIEKNPEKLYGLKRICRAHNEYVGKLIKEGMETLKYSSE